LLEKPDLIIVPGDVNSTLACSLVAVKMGIKIAHVEAGLRSFARSMPEEINRILTDHISVYLFVSESSGIENLRREGISDEKVFFTGNVMIDSLIRYLPLASASDVRNMMGLGKQPYILVTFHRPSNVDDPGYLAALMSMLLELAAQYPVVFPAHPRTMQHLQKQGLDVSTGKGIILCEPMPYIDFIALIANARLIVTDSGGIQEEACYLGIQCITVRENTERPVTVEIGTNTLAGRNLSDVLHYARQRLAGDVKTGSIPELWDGKAASRIVEIILTKLA
jgi:UDP-N-acetylglucosamine 2-epimerase (non-hydrolysing)